jgi:HAMP domain-containing protein
MKIQTQNAITILPIFLVLAIISSGLLFVTERQEIYWGLNEEASSLAVSIAEFLNGKELDDIRTQEDSIQSIINWKQAKRIKIFSIKSEKLSLFAAYGDESYDYQTETSDNTNQLTFQYFTFDKYAINKILTKGLIVSDLLELPSSYCCICAYVPLYSSSKQICGILEVTIDAQEIKTRTRELLISSIKITIGILLFGFLIVFIISRQITNSIVLLNKAASIISSGNYEYEITEKGTLNIQEVNDLSNTFNTMSSVLREFSSQSKQELIEAEQFRTSYDLANNYLEKYSPPINVTLGRYKTLIYRFGKNITSDFFDTFTYESSSYVIIGKTKYGTSLHDLTYAASALSLIKETLTVTSIKETLEKVTQLFEMERCYILQWRDTSPRIEMIKYSNESLDSYVYQPDEKNPIVISTTSIEMEEKLQLYVKRFYDINDDELIKELFFLVEEDDNGIMCIIKK